MSRHRWRGIAASLAVVVLFSGMVIASPAGAFDPGPFGIQQMMTQSGTLSFGSDVALSGKTAAVGMAINGASTLFVYVRSGDTWALQQAIKSPLTTADRFGQAVAIDGDTMVVGANADDQVAADAGRAYVYTRSGTTWSLQDELVATDGAAGDFFGTSVAVSGDVAVVGAPQHDVGPVSEQGAAYVFRRAGGVWTQEQMLTATDGAAGDDFGYAVDIDGTTLVVGAPYQNAGATEDVGRAYVWTRGLTNWGLQQSIQPSTFEWGNWGVDVSLSGNTLLMGVNNGDPRIFTRSGTVWSQQQALMPSAENSGDWFGQVVDLCGDTAVVGAPGLTVGGRLNNGGAFVFTRSGTIWSEAKALTASDGAAQDHFGQAVATNGTCALVGAPWESASAGKAYFYSTPAPILTPVYRFYNARLGTHFYTADEAEKQNVINTLAGTFAYEGPAYGVNPAVGTQSLWRFYNRRTGTHFYTASDTERDSVNVNLGYIYTLEGPAYNVSAGPVPGALTVYRFYNIRNGTHFYTADEAELDNVRNTLGAIYQYEGPAFWVGQ